MPLVLLLAFAPALLAYAPATASQQKLPAKKAGHKAVTKSQRAIATGMKTSSARTTSVYKRVNALRTVKVTSAKRRTGVAMPVISPRLREASLLFVTSRMEGMPDHLLGVDALRPFFERLAQSARDGLPIHVLQYGDSHTASDDWAESMREAFQDRYGFGGPGFSMAGHPYKGYRRFDVQGENSPGWITQGTVGHFGDGRDGLAGVSLTTTRPGETVKLTTSGEDVELYFLQQPGGGSFTLEADGTLVDTINTDSELSTGFYQLAATPGEHTYLVRTLSAQPVRLFGWVSQNQKGITWETLGINGAQANMILEWDEPLWREQIQRRDPALVVIAYGTNEALYPLWTAADYRRDLLSVIQRFRSAVPNAALLLVGPPNCGRVRPFPYLRDVIQIQGEVARETGVAFWDWQSHMDNSGGRLMWVRAGLSQADYTHLTGDGYRMLGKALAKEIDLEYRRYLAQVPVAE